MEIRSEGLVATYPGARRAALRGVDFSAGPGLHLVLGPAGAGKSTLLRVLAGQVPPASGQVRVGGRDVRRHPLAVRRTLGYVPQETGLPRELTLREYLDELLALDGEAAGPRRAARLQEAAAAVRLQDELDRRLRQLSTGMRRRALIAQALLGTPEALLADEPTAGLDPEEQIAVHALLRSSARRSCVVLATRYIGDAAALSGRVTLLRDGRVLASLGTAELIATAQGCVWAVGREVRPGDDYVLRPTADRSLQRLIGTLPPGTASRPLPPTLEDGYLLALHRARPGGAA